MTIHDCPAPVSKPKRKRDYGEEIQTLLSEREPMSKNELIRQIGARGSTVRRTVDELTKRGVLVRVGKRWTLATSTYANIDLYAVPERRVHVRTPREVLERVVRLGDVGLDPCAAPRNKISASMEWSGTRYDDGLARSWKNYGLVYCFPPSSDSADWARKISSEASSGVEIVALLPCRMRSVWFHDFVLSSVDAICYWRGSLRAPGESRNSVFARAVCYWGPRTDIFCEAFSSVGSITVREQMHRVESWTLVVPRPSAVQTWIESRGPRSKAVKNYIKRFSEEIGLANAHAGCPRATTKRYVLITRYGILATRPTSLQRGGQLVVDMLEKRGLLSREHGYDIEWKQSIDRLRQRTEIQISTRPEMTQE